MGDGRDVERLGGLAMAAGCSDQSILCNRLVDIGSMGGKTGDGGNSERARLAETPQIGCWGDVCAVG